MADYLVSGARLQCSFGTVPANLNVPVPNGVTINNKNVATAVDVVPMVNIGCFGKCNVVPAAPKPCTPAGTWLNAKTSAVTNEIPMLTKDSYMICMAGGGKISPMTTGQ